MPTKTLRVKKRKSIAATSLKKELDAALQDAVATKLEKDLPRRPAIGLFCNTSYQTVIALEHDHDYDAVVCLRISMTDGLHLERIAVARFEKEFRPREIEGLDKAARTYAEFTRYLGATEDALARLQSIISLTPEEVAMAKGRAEERKKTTDEKKEKVKTKSKAKATTAVKSGDAPTAKKEKKVTVSQVFQDLIMEGKWTDDQIFEKVQAQFGLEKKQRSYVAWYRNYLRKQGKNPPAEKKA